MANRSYVYATDTIPTARTNGLRVIGLSEWAYDIPLSHKILVAGEPRIIQSFIWDHPIAIAGNFALGLRMLLELLTKLQNTEEIKYPDVFNEVCDETREYMDIYKRTYSVLEPAEILDMDEYDLEDGISELYAEIQELGQQLADIQSIPPTELFSHTEIPWLERIAEDWEEALGITDWGEQLYYDISV